MHLAVRMLCLTLSKLYRPPHFMNICIVGKSIQCHLQMQKRAGKTIPKSSVSHPLYGYKFPSSLPVGTDDLPQSEAKKLLPPGCDIWRANKKGAWMFHLVNHPRGSAPWKRHGGNSRLAMLECVASAWRMYLDDHALPLSHCPIKNLLV